MTQGTFFLEIDSLGIGQIFRNSFEPNADIRLLVIDYCAINMLQRRRNNIQHLNRFAYRRIILFQGLT